MPAGFTVKFVAWLKVLCSGVPFPKNFRDTVRTIFRRLFRVYAHLYSNHFDQICALGIEGLRIGPLANVLLADRPTSTSKHELPTLFPVRARGS